MASLRDAMLSVDREEIPPPIAESKTIKRVTWADGTAEAPSARLAVSIPRHRTNQVSV